MRTHIITKSYKSNFESNKDCREIERLTKIIKRLVNVVKRSIKTLERSIKVKDRAHTIGTAHCSSFRDRFQQDSKGKLTLIDKSLDSSYANELMKECPLSASPSMLVNKDPETSMVFDNQYYRNLVNNKGLFQSDSALLSDNRTRRLVEDLAKDQQFFFQSWGQSFLKLTTIGVKTGDEGEIRSFCASTNA
ncbi:peroxidase 46-like [Vigna umbellata]|uniref:peroxidase 46-like n=1 Tax=Vigna umbellata TaxID=87088 RepID=UPI001F5FC7D5|nr:peroxidase 46-like [Vigna umbellata]